MQRLVCLLIALIAAPAFSMPDPLFQSDETLSVTIRAPFDRILKTRSLEEEEEGTFSFTDADGKPQEFNIKIRARGKSRRDAQTCTFPPIRLNFKKSETKDTLFHKQDKLKLVTHCKADSVVYRQGVLREFIVYRIFNELTDKSFRVRALQVTYEDSEGRRKPLTEFGFLIEHKERLGKRIGAKPLELIGSVDVLKIRSEYMNLATVFHYMIANVDFSAFAAAEENNCCHNHVLFGEEDGLYYSIPYDFDMAGFVSAEYATPNPRYGLRRITQRFYRGRCTNNQHLPETLALFREKRATIVELINSFPQLSRYSRKLTMRLIGEFYEIVDDPRLIESRMVSKCF